MGFLAIWLFGDVTNLGGMSHLILIFAARDCDGFQVLGSRLCLSQAAIIRAITITMACLCRGTVSPPGVAVN